ncbi:MAG: hypothetical protein ABIV28_00835 [Longimicrobiales bacterium]
MTVLVALPLHGQARLQLKAGFAASGLVLRDQIATPGLRSLLGNGVDEDVSARFKPAAMLGLGVEVPLRPGTQVMFAGSWSGTTLEAEDGAGTRDVQDVSVIQAVFGMRRMIGDLLEASGGFGAIYFSGDGRGLMAGGADVAPLVEAGLGGGWNSGEHRIHVRAVGQLHRFGTEAITSIGGQSGNVKRYGIEAAFTWKGAVAR